jgi:D-mannonate dehydratase
MRRPETHGGTRACGVTRAIHIETGRDNPRLAQPMIEHHQTVVKAHRAIGQLEVVDGASRQTRLDEVLQVVTPVAEAATERKRKVRLIQQFVARHQPIEHVPRVAVLGLGSGV